MGSDKWDPPHTIRMPDQLWNDLAEAAADAGHDRSSLLRAYARRYVAAWKGRRAKGDHGPGSSDTGW